jgi:REP element-mobilizing transposase RayT
MGQSISEVWLHIIFATKKRQPFLSNPGVRGRMHAYLAGACRELKCPARIVNGTANHVHLLCRLGKTITISSLILSIKRSSSKWIKPRGGMLSKFSWQNGYAAFSVSPSRLRAVENYIANQERHHRRIGFKDELLKFLKEYEIELNEAHLWD